MNESNSLMTNAPADAVVICGSCGRQAQMQDTFQLQGAHYCAQCKPQVMQRIASGEPIVSPAAEEMRRKYIKHEASVKSIGILYYLGGIALVVAGISIAIAAIAGVRRDTAAVSAILGVGLAILGIGQFSVGAGLRRLRSWARIPVGILSGIGLLGFPMGTIINGYILYLVFSEKGTTVFSPEY